MPTKFPNHQSADHPDQQVKHMPPECDADQADHNHGDSRPDAGFQISPLFTDLSIFAAHVFTAPKRRSRPPYDAQSAPNSSRLKSGHSVSMNSYSA